MRNEPRRLAAWRELVDADVEDRPIAPWALEQLQELAHELLELLARPQAPTLAEFERLLGIQPFTVRRRRVREQLIVRHVAHLRRQPGAKRSAVPLLVGAEWRLSPSTIERAWRRHRASVKTGTAK